MSHFLMPLFFIRMKITLLLTSVEYFVIVCEIMFFNVLLYPVNRQKLVQVRYDEISAIQTFSYYAIASLVFLVQWPVPIMYQHNIFVSSSDSEGSGIEKRKLIPRRPGISWSVGSKLEAMDFLKKWQAEQSKYGTIVFNILKLFSLEKYFFCDSESFEF